jgi:hypothetical protein
MELKNTQAIIIPAGSFFITTPFPKKQRKGAQPRKKQQSVEWRSLA